MNDYEKLKLVAEWRAIGRDVEAEELMCEVEPDCVLGRHTAGLRFRRPEYDEYPEETDEHGRFVGRLSARQAAEFAELVRAQRQRMALFDSAPWIPHCKACARGTGCATHDTERGLEPAVITVESPWPGIVRTTSALQLSGVTQDWRGHFPPSILGAPTPFATCRGLRAALVEALAAP